MVGIGNIVHESISRKWREIMFDKQSLDNLFEELRDEF